MSCHCRVHTLHSYVESRADPHNSRMQLVRTCDGRSESGANSPSPPPVAGDGPPVPADPGVVRDSGPLLMRPAGVLSAEGVLPGVRVTPDCCPAAKARARALHIKGSRFKTVALGAGWEGGRTACITRLLPEVLKQAAAAGHDGTSSMSLAGTLLNHLAARPLLRQSDTEWSASPEGVLSH